MTYKKILTALLSVIIALSVCACADDDGGQVLYADLGQVSELDPQLVTSDTDRTAVLNLFEGLMRISDDGTPVTGAASEYRKEGLTYTFYINKDTAWDDGTPLTAYDFQFALRRAAAPETAAPDFQRISCIKGAPEIHGAGADVSSLMAVVLDSHTLQITLSYDDEGFLSALAEPIAMPCNEAFFKSTNGRYGRDGKSLLSNGAFYLYSWETDNFKIRMRRNEHYGGTNKAIPAAVYLTDSDEDNVTLLSNNDIDFSFIPASHTEKAENAGLNTQKYFDCCLFLVINKSSALGSDNIRSALFSSIHRNALENELPSYICPLNAAVQINASVGGTPLYDSIALNTFFDYQPDEAYKLYLDATKQLKSCESQTIIYPKEAEIDSFVSGIASSWQQNLGLFINMSALNSDTVTSRVANKNYAVAVYPIKVGTDNPYDLLARFKSDNPFDFQSTRYDETVNSLISITDASAYANTVIQAQSILLEGKTVLPLVSVPTVLCTTKAISQISYCTSGEYINFSTIIKNR